MPTDGTGTPRMSPRQKRVSHQNMPILRIQLDGEKVLHFHMHRINFSTVKEQAFICINLTFLPTVSRQQTREKMPHLVP
jgi:hypothetical protein